MKEKLLFLLLSLLQIIGGESVYDVIQAPCSTNGTLINYNINSNKIAQFFTPDFPTSLVKNKTGISCQAKFYTVVENERIWMALYNGFTDTYYAFDDNSNQFHAAYLDSNEKIASFSSETQSLTFRLSDVYSSKWIAYQGVVIAYDPTTVQCPFSGETIKFTDAENPLVIPIASNFGEKNSETNCYWEFSTYVGQYLKVVIKKLILNRNVVFELQQSGKTIKRFDKNINDTKVYYFSSSDGPFTLYYNDTNGGNYGTGFSALISYTNVPTSSTAEECSSLNDGKLITIKNLDYEFGYKPNQRCEHLIDIQKNQEVKVKVTVSHFEKNVDTLNLIFKESVYPLYKKSSIQLTSAANQSLISFIADSNIQQAGFEVTLKTLECVCPPGDIIIPCGSHTTVTPLGTGENSYCNNMKCSYRISTDPTCSYDGFQFYLISKIRENLDYFNIYANGILREKLTEEMDYDRLFTSDTNITVEFISDASNEPVKDRGNWWTLELMSQDLPPVEFSMLNKSLPYYAVELSSLHQGNIISVCSPFIDTLELIIAAEKENLQNYILYDGIDFDNYIGSLDSPSIFGDNPNFGRIISESSCFTIQTTGEFTRMETGVFLFRMQNAQTQNCGNTDNIFLLSFEYANFSYTANGPCEIIFLSPENPANPLSIDSIDGSESSYFNLKSAINQNFFARIFSTNFQFWNNLKLFTPALSVSLHPGPTFNMTAKLESDGIIYAKMDEQIGIMASPSYSFFDDSDTIFPDPLYTVRASDSNKLITAEFQLREGNETLLIKSDTAEGYLTHPGGVVEISGTEINLYRTEPYSKNDSFRIFYSLKLNPIATTSTFPSTSTNPFSTTIASTTSQTATSSDATSESNNPSSVSQSTPSITTTSEIPTTSENGVSKNFSEFVLLTAIKFFVTFIL